MQQLDRGVVRTDADRELRLVGAEPQRSAASARAIGLALQPALPVEFPGQPQQRHPDIIGRQPQGGRIDLLAQFDPNRARIHSRVVQARGFEAQGARGGAGRAREQQGEEPCRTTMEAADAHRLPLCQPAAA